MHKIFNFFAAGLILCCLLLMPVSAIAQIQPPAINAKSAILVDVDNGQILYSKDHLVQRPIASTTKVMTAIVALGAADLKGVVEISPRAASVGESSMQLRAGEKLTLEQLMYGALLRSGNDACVAIAEHVAGSEDLFVLLMNEKAAILGALDSSFKNTNGLPAAGHYSTAYDLAMIARYALNDPVFCDIVKTRVKIIDDSIYGHYLKNTNRLLWNYPWADGVKTGTTGEAGKCLIASAHKEDRRLLAVILNDQDRFDDAQVLLEYGYSAYEPVTMIYQGEICGRVAVANGVINDIPVMTAKTVTVNMPRHGKGQVETKIKLFDKITAPVKQGQLVGRISYYVDGVEVEQVDVLAASNAQKLSWFQNIKRNIKL